MKIIASFGKLVDQGAKWIHVTFLSLSQRRQEIRREAQQIPLFLTNGCSLTCCAETKNLTGMCEVGRNHKGHFVQITMLCIML